MILEQKPYNAPVVINGKETEQPAGFLALYLSKQAMSGVLPANDSSLPKNCAIHKVNAPTPVSRASWLENSLNNSPREADYRQLEALIEQMNLERARISLATGALTIVAKARTELEALIRDLQG
jgi:hypothetical protein